MTNAGHGIPVDGVCQSHLNSMHAEIHQEDAIFQQHDITKNRTHLGHIKWGQYIPEEVEPRHEELAHELDYRSKQSRTRNGHDSPRSGVASIDAALVVGPFPVEALKLYNRNVWRSKECDCELPGDSK